MASPAAHGGNGGGRWAVVGRTPSGNPLPRRGKVKERIVKEIVSAVATAAVLACDRTAAADAKKGKAAAAAAPAYANKN